MAIYFSNERGFQIGVKGEQDIHKGAVEISQELYASLRKAELQGKLVRAVGADVKAIDPPEMILNPELELLSLDTVLPRFLEDTWGAIPGFDIRLLPEIVQRRLQRKRVLRAWLAREAPDR